MTANDPVGAAARVGPSTTYNIIVHQLSIKVYIFIKYFIITQMFYTAQNTNNIQGGLHPETVPLS